MPRIRQMAWVATEHAERRHHGPTRGHNRGRRGDPRRLQWETAATVAAIKRWLRRLDSTLSSLVPEPGSGWNAVDWLVSLGKQGENK